MPEWVEDGGAEARSRGTESGEVYTVVGTVTCPDRPAVGGLYVEIVDRNVEQDIVLAQTLTDERGRYQARFSDLYGKTQPDLQARVRASDEADAEFLGESDVRYNATNYETLDVLLPANSAALPSEHETLTGALREQYEGQLGELEESDDRQDVTYLANKTGWDARAVALAALADQFSEHRATAKARKDFIRLLLRTVPRRAPRQPRHPLSGRCEYGRGDLAAGHRAGRDPEDARGRASAGGADISEPRCCARARRPGARGDVDPQGDAASHARRRRAAPAAIRRALHPRPRRPADVLGRGAGGVR